MNERNAHARTRDQNRDSNLHRDQENLVTVGRISLDHCAQVWVPETNNSVLTTREDIFRTSFGVPCDMHGAFVILESGVECTRERLRTSGRCHHCKLPLCRRGCLASPCGCRHRSGRSWWSVTALLATIRRHQWPRDHTLRLTSLLRANVY